MRKKIVIVPCSGIGKSYGTVAREGAFAVTKDLRPEQTQLVPLSLLVLGDEIARDDVSDTQAIAIDGCKLACAAKMVAESGGDVAHELAVLDVYRRHREFKPRGIAELNEGGHKLAQALAQEVAELVDELSSLVKCSKPHPRGDFQAGAAPETGAGSVSKDSTRTLELRSLGKCSEPRPRGDFQAGAAPETGAGSVSKDLTRTLELLEEEKNA